MPIARLFCSAHTLLLFVVLSFACAAMAQTESGTISGLITDNSGAVVTNAELQLKSVERGTVTTVTTNKAGIYVFAGVHPGQYQLTVRTPGFKQVDLPTLIVNIQDHIEQNFRLQVGSASESVTVTAEAPLVNTTDASVSTVVDQTYVKNMPLNGRSFQDLILLTPGAVTLSPQNQAGTGFGQGGEFSVNGQRTESNYFTVDGVGANLGVAAGTDMTFGSAASGSVASATALGTTQALVSVDELQEFRTQSSTYSAEYGRNPGAQFAFETKSGTNQWHGTAYDYLRNGVFDANDWFNNYFGVSAPGVRQNDFGGTLGGPVTIPGLYKGTDKTFFFVSYEGLRLAAPQAANINFVPSVALRASAPAPLKQALDAFPMPNGPDVGNGIAEFIDSWSNPGSINSTSVRLDHVVNNKLRVFFRFNDTGSRSAVRATSQSTSIVPTSNNIGRFTIRTYTAGATSLLSNHLSNDFRLNYSSNEVNQLTVIDAFGGGVPVDLAQLAGFNADSDVQVQLDTGGPFTILEQGHSTGVNRQWNAVDSISLSLGHHQLKFGVDYRRLTPFAVPHTFQANYRYPDEASVAANSGAVAIAVANAPFYPLYTNFSAFVQDQWKVSQRLNLSLGLRWEVNPPPGVTRGLNEYTIQGSDPDTWTLAPQGTTLWKTTWYNFAPRLGAAYVVRNEPNWETVVRGGVGVFFDTAQQLGSGGFGYGPGFRARTITSGESFPGTVTIPTIPSPPQDQAGLDALLASAGIGWGVAPHLQLPYTLQWNASVQQALGKSQALTVSYVGSHGSRLLQQNFVFPASNPNAFLFVVVRNGLSSDYQSLQTQFRRNLSQGLTVLGDYTWSHCIDYGSTNFLSGYQRGNCEFDIRHNFSAAFSYDLPNVGNSAFAKAVLHNWGIDDRFTARTAFPVNLSGNTIFDPLGNATSSGMNFVSGQPIYLYGASCASFLQGLGNLQPGQPCPGDRAINPCAFVAVGSTPSAPCPTGTVGGLVPRNFLRGFGAWQMNFAVRREFPIREKLKLQFRAEAFNIFNHPNFGRIDGFIFDPTFGQATATLANSLVGLNPLYQTGGPRSMQFALKLTF